MSNEMKLKINFDNINKSEKPVQSLVNFFTNNCTLRMLKKTSSDEIEITDSAPFAVNTDEDHWQMVESEIYLYLGEGYDGFNGKCKWLSITFKPEAEPEDPDIVLEDTTVSLEGFDGLDVKGGKCKVQHEKLEEALSEYDTDWSSVLEVEVQLTHKAETKWAANIINDNKLDDGCTLIASIKYGNASESNDRALVQKNDDTNPVIDCDTKFVKSNTALKFYEMYSAEEEVHSGTEILEHPVELLPMIEIPVTITPYCNGKENIDENIIPKFVDDSSTEDINESIIQNYNMQNKSLPVDWKLRTTTFTLRCDENEFYDVFYKVGFCPADGKEVTEKEVVESLKLCAFMIENIENHFMFSLRYPEWAKHKFEWSQFPITVKPMWFPIYSDDIFVGIMYVELYNSEDGTKFNADLLKDKEWYVQVNRDEYADQFYAQLKDRMIDKGYIYSVRNEVPS